MIRAYSKSSRFIALLPDDLQGGFSVVVTANGVDSFSASWPCANLGSGPIRFDYAGNGDLVGESRSTERADAGAALALCQDAQEFGDKAMAKRRAKLEVSR